ncbi:unnamed protein product [Alopecurus aequalis]
MPESSSPAIRRGLFSCLHSKCDAGRSSGFKGKGVTELLHDLLADIYAEAFDRLAFEGLQGEDAEELLTAMCTGGVCVGLLDPVSNIILNTISVLPSGFPSDHPPPRRSKRLAGAPHKSTNPRKRKRRAGGPAQPEHVWSYISSLSCFSLVRFLVRYFGCITSEQAERYLHWARADLTLAVLLVDHDLHAAAQPQLLDPASERTQAALKCAATTGRHPAPDVLVRLHTSPLPREILHAAAPFLVPGGRNLTLHDFDIVIHSLRYQESASQDLQVNLLPDRRGVVVYCRDFSSDQGKLIHNVTSMSHGGRFSVVTINVERHGYHFASLRDENSIRPTFSEKLEKAFQAASHLQTCGDACEYTQSLKMRLHGTMHALYLKAFTMLPSHVSHRLVRYILFAGHCYGPMDPVSNIILNSIWYSIVFPLPSSVDSESQVAYDITDPLSMLRVEVRSFKGLITLVKASSSWSTQRAMEHLCSNGCHLSEEMHTPHWFAAAAQAAQHPQHAALGKFLSSLTPHVLDNLRPLLRTSDGGTLSSESLDQVERILTKELRETAASFAAGEAKLSKAAEDTLLKKMSEYNNFRLFIRSQLAKVLKKYALEHPEEPKYVPSVICGVVAGYNSDRDSYHVNFVGASESGGSDNQLFFAEINLPCNQPKPDICSRICLAQTGRCYYGQLNAIKIVYPPSSAYFDTDITLGGIKQADMMLGSDFVFGFRREGLVALSEVAAA